MIAIAYDGSDPAKRAIQAAAELFPGGEADVLTVWRTAHDFAGAARIAVPDGLVQQGLEALDRTAEEEACKTAGEGTALANEAGLRARAAQAMGHGSGAAAIMSYAREHDAAAIVVGARGLSGVRSALLGSVSNAIVHNADRPVIVTPAHAADPNR